MSSSLSSSLRRLLLSATLAVIAVPLAPAVARAQFTVYTDLASFLAATTGAGTDRFDDLAVGASVPSPLARTAGAFGYTATVNTTTLYGAGAGTDHWLSTNTSTDIITFSGFSTGVRGVGGFFFGSTVTGAFRPATGIVVKATNAAGSTTRTLLDTTLGTFLGFVSTGDIFSLTVEAVPPQAGFAWPTVNDFVLARAPVANVVPEPAAGALLASGLFGLLVVVVRRRGRAPVM